MLDFNIWVLRFALFSTCLGLAGPSLADPNVQDLKPQWQTDLAAQAQTLRRGQGLVIIDTAVERKVSAWTLGESLPTLTPPMGRHLQVIALPKGKYHWQSISVPLFNLPHRRSLKKSSRWSFKVQPNKLNYFGTLFVGKHRGSDAVDVRLVNRSAEVLALLENHQPDLLNQLPLIYSGNFRDDYFDLIQVNSAFDAKR